MKAIWISRAKPNPAGRDRYASYIPPKQLAAEWIDIKNIGTEPHPLEEISLNHRVRIPTQAGH